MSRTGTAIGVAMALAGTAIAVEADTRRAERKHPPIGEFIEAGGVRLHYLRRGRGDPTVVFLHGNGAMVEDFASSGLLDMVASTHRVVAFDRPGFGHSRRPRGRAWTAQEQAQVILQAMSHLGIERPIVVGHSWGTLVALAMALDHPDRISGLVLLSGYYYPTARLDVVIASPPAIPILGDVMRHTISPILGTMLTPLLIRKLFRPAPVSRRFQNGFPTSLVNRPSQIRASAEDTALMVPTAAALARRYRDLRLPVTIIAGAGDRMVDHRRHALRLHREVPHSNILVLQGEGHMIHHGAAGLVAAAVNTISKQGKQVEAATGEAPEPIDVPQATREVLEPDSRGG